MHKPKANFPLSLLNLLGFLVVLVVNALATTIPLGGKTTGQISDQYPNLFVPAGLTFAIWGVIYLLIGAYVIYGLLSSARADSADSFPQRIGVLFLVTCAANAAWIIAWHYQRLLLSLGWMTILLLALIAIYVRLGVGRSTAASMEKYLVHLPMSVYLGWITIAAIANATAVLVAHDWDRFGMSDQVWAVTMVAVGAALGLVMLFRRNDIFYALVVDWALLGIFIKRTADSGNPATAVVAASAISMGMLTMAIVAQIARGKVYR